MEISAASCLSRLLSNVCCYAQLRVRLIVHFFSFEPSSVGVSGRWGDDVHPKDETQFLVCADKLVKQLWVFCMQHQEPRDTRK